MKRLIIASVVLAAFGLTGCKAEEVKPDVKYFCEVEDVYDTSTGNHIIQFVNGSKNYKGSRVMVKGDNSGFMYEDVLGAVEKSPKLHRQSENLYSSENGVFSLKYDEFGDIDAIEIKYEDTTSVIHECVKR